MLAALTMASTFSVVMSPRTSLILDRMVGSIVGTLRLLPSDRSIDRPENRFQMGFDPSPQRLPTSTAKSAGKAVPVGQQKTQAIRPGDAAWAGTPQARRQPGDGAERRSPANRQPAEIGYADDRPVGSGIGRHGEAVRCQPPRGDAALCHVGQQPCRLAEQVSACAVIVAVLPSASLVAE